MRLARDAVVAVIEARGSLPNAERRADRICSLPLYPP
jgi:hypothetical protein